MKSSKDAQGDLGVSKAEPPTSLILRSAGLEAIHMTGIRKCLQIIDSPLASASDSIILGVSHIDFNDNALASLEGIQLFQGIIHLNLAKNAILPSTLTFLSPPIGSTITHLNLSNNNLGSIPWKELKCLPRLTDLKLDHNNIQEIGTRDMLQSSVLTLPIKSLSLNHNQLKSVSGLQYFSTLDYLDVGNNLLGPSVEDCGIACLNDPSLSIQNLSFKGNALCGSRCYIHTMYQYFPALKILDGEMIMLNEQERKRRCDQLKRRCGCPTIVPEIREHSTQHIFDDNHRAKKSVSPVTVRSPTALSRDNIAFQHRPASPKVEAKILNEMNIEKSTILICDKKPEKERVVRKKHVSMRKIPRKANTRVDKEKIKMAKASKQSQVRPTQMISSHFTKLDGFYGNRNKSLPLRLLGRNKRRGNYNKFTKLIMSRRRNFVSENQQRHTLFQPQRPSSDHPGQKGCSSPRIQKHARASTNQTNVARNKA